MVISDTEILQFHQGTPLAVQSRVCADVLRVFLGSIKKCKESLFACLPKLTVAFELI